MNIKMKEDNNHIQPGQGEQQKLSPSKPFLTMGPTLHYKSHNVEVNYGLNLCVYAVVCLFWAKIMLGAIEMFRFDLAASGFGVWSLGGFINQPISIFEFPWQMLVLAALTAIITFTPVITSQMLSVNHSLPFLIICMLVAKLPGLSFVIMISCIMVASRPLRFRSRFISIVLCSSPILIYLTVSGNSSDPDPLKWGLSFVPWILTWLLGLAMSAIILAVGHFTRYRPGQIWITSLLFFVIGLFTFFDRIGLAEVEYKQYVSDNIPEMVEGFKPHDISAVLDRAVKNPMVSIDDAFLFSGIETLQRGQLVSELQEMLLLGSWPYWFIENCDSDFYDYEKKRSSIIEQYDAFIANHPKSPRGIPALYYKAMLKEYKPDIPALKELEQLRFYSSYPGTAAYSSWIKLYKDHPDSVEALEARWRIAMNLAGKQKFTTSASICREILNLAEEKEKIVERSVGDEAALFRRPPETVITPMDFRSIIFRTKYLLQFLSGDYLKEAPEKLAEFLMLDKRSLNYRNRLALMDASLPADSALKDNVVLEIIKKDNSGLMLIEELEKFIQKTGRRDASGEAQYICGKTWARLWMDNQSSLNSTEYLAKSRALLSTLIAEQPESLFVDEAKTILSELPAEE
ncbi:MAG: tol-pal system YbgF family protein [Phycisphaerae bacterium]|jgi:hypothetical protein